MLIQPLNRYTWVDEWYSSCWLVCCCRGDWCAVMSDWNWRGSRDGYLLLPPCCYSCLCCCCSQMRLLGGLCPIVWVKHCLVRVMVSVSVQFRFLFSPFFSLYVYTIYVYIFFDPLSLSLLEMFVTPMAGFCASVFLPSRPASIIDLNYCSHTDDDWMIGDFWLCWLPLINDVGRCWLLDLLSSNTPVSLTRRAICSIHQLIR